MVAKKYQMTPFQKQNPKMNVKPNAKATAIALIGHGLENYTIHQILATLRVVMVSGNLTKWLVVGNATKICQEFSTSRN